MKLVEALEDIFMLPKGTRGYMADNAAAKAVKEKKVKVIANNVKTKSMTEVIEAQKEKEDKEQK